MTVVPSGWSTIELGEALLEPLANGRSVPDRPGGFPVLRLTAVRDRRIDLEQCKAGAWSENEARPYLVREGDLLIVRGNGSLHLVGRAGVVGAVTAPVAYPDTLIRVRADPALIESRYMSLLWDSPAVRDQIEASARTTAGIYKVNQSQLRCVKLPVPSLDEQRRIVDILEDHLSRLDAADDYLDAASRRIGQLVHSEERTLIAASAAGRASFDEVFRPVSDEGRRVAQSDYLAEGPVPVIDQGEGLVGGFTSVGHAFDGELPVIVFGDHTRRAKYVDFRFAVGAQGVKLLRAMPGVLPRFAYYLVRGANLRSRGYGRHYAMLRASSFVLPPPERQAEVVAELDSMVATTDALEQHVSVLRRRNWALRRTLLAAAFSGRLTGRASDLDLAEELVS